MANVTLALLLNQTLYSLSPSAEVIFVENARTWADAQLDCESRGTNLLTAQGNADVCQIKNKQYIQKPDKTTYI